MVHRIVLVCVASAVAAIAWAASSAIDNAKQKLKEGKHEEAIAALEAEWKRNPKQADLKAALADTHTAYGEFYMFNEQMPPFRKYPAALRQFRKALEYVPEHKKAKEHIATIEGIYKSMGREVPK